MKITAKVNMDLLTGCSPVAVKGVQDDRYTRSLEITLTAAGEAWIIPGDASALVRFSRSDGTGGTYNTLPDGTQAWSAAGNVLTVALAPQVFAVPGPVSLWVTLIRDELQLSTFTVMLNVDPNAGECTKPDGSYVNVLGFLPGVAGAQAGQIVRITAVREDGYAAAAEAVDLEHLAVVHTAQTLTDDQKLQARTNIGAVSAKMLTAEVETALTEAKKSGEFDGADGKTPVKGEDYWTAADQSAIISEVLSALPTWEGGSY